MTTFNVIKKYRILMTIPNILYVSIAISTLAKNNSTSTVMGHPWGVIILSIISSSYVLFTLCQWLLAPKTPTPETWQLWLNRHVPTYLIGCILQIGIIVVGAISLWIGSNMRNVNNDIWTLSIVAYIMNFHNLIIYTTYIYFVNDYVAAQVLII